jgi:hypothetical protein
VIFESALVVAALGAELVASPPVGAGSGVAAGVSWSGLGGPKPADLVDGERDQWSALKGKDLANYAATDLTDLWGAAHRGLQRIRRNAALLWSFLAHTGLQIPSTGS